MARSHNASLEQGECRAAHAVHTALRVLRSLKLPTAALHLVECTFHGGFDSHTLPPAQHSSRRESAVIYDAVAATSNG